MDNMIENMDDKRDGLPFEVPVSGDELDALLSDLKQQYLQEDEAALTGEVPAEAVGFHADSVQLDNEPVDGEEPSEPEEDAEDAENLEEDEAETEREFPASMPPLTFYEQSRPAYQTARRAQYEREREEGRLRREREQLARESREAEKMRELENRRKKPRHKAGRGGNRPGSEGYAQWLYEQGSDPQTVSQREQTAQLYQTLPIQNPRKKKKFGLWTALLILLALAAVGVSSLFFLARQPVNEESIGARKKNASTILLAGVDEGGYRTDTMMLLSLDREAGTIGLVSIPRDTLVYCEYTVPKLNSAYGWAGGGEEGMEELMLRISEIIGFAPDGYLVVNMGVLEKLVDQMGGVKFDVPMDMDYEDPSQELSIHLSAGEQKLNGEEAVQLLRFRSGYPTADLGRVDVQREFLSAALDQWVSVKRVFALPGALKLLEEATESNLTARNYLWLIETVMVCNRTDIKTATLPGEARDIVGGSYYVLEATGVAETVNGCCNPYQNGIAVSDLYLRVG